VPNWYIQHGAARLALTADFAQRTISTQISQDFHSEQLGDSVGGFAVYTTPGLDLHGTGVIASSGSLNIPLTGTMTVVPQNGAFSVTGALDGAFFGPNAEQIGGVYSVSGAPGTGAYSDAFIGTKN
jgi:hypothetical protein